MTTTSGQSVIAQKIGDYLLEGRIAIGGMSEIFQARATDDQKRAEDEPERVILKRLLPHHRADPHWVRNFQDEAAISLQLKHPNLVRTFRQFQSGPDYLLVQSLVTGWTLELIMNQFTQASESLPPESAVYIATCLLNALDYLHTFRRTDGGVGYVHRDLNPANVLISVEGEVRLTDFGVMEPLNASHSIGSALKGTLSYIAPEAALGYPVDARADIFALGVVLWELVTGQRLFSGHTEIEILDKLRSCRIPPATSLKPSIPAQLSNILHKALQVDRADRFSSAAQFRASLELLATRYKWRTDASAIAAILSQ